jgi:hypothetical protein
VSDPSVSEADRLLSAATSILVIDWPSADVPDTLAGAGYAVYVKGGPEPHVLGSRDP